MGKTTSKKKKSKKGAVLDWNLRSDGVVIITMDVPGQSVNTLKEDFAEEFETVLEAIGNEPDARAVVFTSGKEKGFVAGADVSALRELETAEEATELSRRAQEGMNRLAEFKLPVVAAIHGDCLGGGLELALACHGRVASEDRSTKLGLPEVKLGVIPGAGGTQRLPRLIGVQEALNLILTGRRIPAQKAKKLGLVDEVVPNAILTDVAADHALRLAEGKGGESWSDSILGTLSIDHLQTALLEDNPLGRMLLFSQARKRTLSKTKGNYPAPERALEVIQAGLDGGLEAGLEAEAEAFGQLAVTQQSRELMGIFFAQQALKKDPGVDDPDVKPLDVEKVGVLGAGLMGAGITYVTVEKTGVPVRLKDIASEGLRSGLSQVRSLLDERVEKRRLTPQEGDVRMALVRPTLHYTGFENVDLVIEAVFEDLDIKHTVLRDVEKHLGPDAIFASNTSSLPISKIAEASERPERVIGMHYFSPVEKMPLLEIIATEKTAPEVIATCVAFGKKQGKEVIVVGDGVGFYTSRILGPYMNEAAFILGEGEPIQKIDEALEQAGFPVGPITLMDEVGLDVGAKVSHILEDAFGARMEAPEGIEKLLDDGRKGKKNRKGFYAYGKKRKKGNKKPDETVYDLLGVRPESRLSADEIAERCILQMVNEACHCYGEGILRSARDGDVGAIFGLGFPPFTGGPFRYVQNRTARIVVERLEAYQADHGLRFQPAPLLKDLAEKDLGPYDEDAPEPGQHS